MPLSAEVIAALREALGDQVSFDEPLARHTSARIGGPADAFMAARTSDDLCEAARLAWTHDVPLRVLGGGSNILIADAGVRGLVVDNRVDWVKFEGQRVRAGSGASTIQLARRLARKGLSGFEWAIGVPGTLGGAVYGNAGAHDGDMKGCVTQVEGIIPLLQTATPSPILGGGGRRPEGVSDITWSNDDLAFEYRSSILKRERRTCVILAVEMAFTPDDPAAINARMKEYNDYRKRTQPPGATIGSMFKNPPGDYAGRLIDAAGLKGTRIGGAQISEKHANFFLNVGEATAADVKVLADLARSLVFDRFGVSLELEIELVGEWN